MSERLIQLLSEGVEELWSFPKDITDEQVKELWEEYKLSDEESFEDYIDTLPEYSKAERLFVDEIYVD